MLYINIFILLFLSSCAHISTTVTEGVSWEGTKVINKKKCEIVKVNVSPAAFSTKMFYHNVSVDKVETTTAITNCSKELSTNMKPVIFNKSVTQSKKYVPCSSYFDNGDRSHVYKTVSKYGQEVKLKKHQYCE